ncbi:MAG: hypothetical protein WA190_00110 [Usitatibacter sp.]
MFEPLMETLRTELARFRELLDDMSVLPRPTFKMDAEELEIEMSMRGLIVPPARFLRAAFNLILKLDSAWAKARAEGSAEENRQRIAQVASYLEDCARHYHAALTEVRDNLEADDKTWREDQVEFFRGLDLVIDGSELLWEQARRLHESTLN